EGEPGARVQYAEGRALALLDECGEALGDPEVFPATGPVVERVIDPAPRVVLEGRSVRFLEAAGEIPHLLEQAVVGDRVVKVEARVTVGQHRSRAVGGWPGCDPAGSPFDSPDACHRVGCRKMHTGRSSARIVQTRAATATAAATGRGSMDPRRSASAPSFAPRPAGSSTA